MSDVTLSKAVRANLLNLQKTAAQLGRTQERLASGLRVNSALDNPTNFFTASSLNSRAADMNALLDAMSNGIQTIEAADNGLTAITKNLESMVSTLTQARQDKSFKAAAYEISSSATGNISFSGGAVGTTPISIALGTGTSSPTAGTSISNGFTSFTLETGTAPTAPVLTSDQAFAALDVSNGDETYAFTVSDDGGVSTVAITLNTAVDTAGNGNGTIELSEAISSINTQLATDGTTTIRARDSLTTPGRIEFYDTTNTGAAATIDLSDVTTGGTTPSAVTSLWSNGRPQATGAATGTPDSIAFNINVDGAGVVPVTLTAAQVAAIGNNDQVVDDITEYQALLQAGLTAAGVTGVTLSNDGTNVTFRSNAAGTSSSVVITGATANNNNATTALAIGNTGLDSTTEAGGAATGGPALRTVDELVSAINNDTNLKTAIRASIDNGKLRIENLSTTELTITGYNATSSSIDGSAGTTAIGGNTVRADLATQYNTLIDQLDKFSDDASFNGVNLLRGDKLKITFNETSTSEIDIQTKDGNAINSANLGVRTSMTAADLDADTAIEGFIVQVKNALRTVRSQASAFGSNLSVVENRQDFTKHMITTLETGASNLTLADTNEEAANLLALQTRQQLSSTALSLASEADQNVLRLF